MIAAVFLALWFAIVATFCGLGAWGAWALGATLIEAHRMQSWAAVPATVEQLELRVMSDEEFEDRSVRARYRYEFDGVPHYGTRLGVTGETIGDSFDGWHGKVHAKLAQAHASGQPLTVWVNPAGPWEAVVDREPRLIALASLLFTTILCGVIGVNGLRKLYRTHFAGSRGRPVTARGSTAGSFPRGVTPGMETGGEATADLPEPPIPRSIASLEQVGDILTLRYSARRRLGSAAWFAWAGGAFIYLGVAQGPPYRRVAGALLLGALLVLVAVARLAGRLVVTVRPGEIRVDQSSLLGRKVWRARREEIRAIRPEVSSRMNYVSNYALFADTGRQRLLLGNGIVGADVANSLARRIARALGAPPSIVVCVGADHGRTPSS